MRKGLVVGLILAVVVCVVLGIAVASIGTQLDQARIDRDELEFEAEDLRTETETLHNERDTLKTERDSAQAERDTLKAQVAEQLNSIERLKAELEQARSQAQAPGGAATAQ